MKKLILILVLFLSVSAYGIEPEFQNKVVCNAEKYVGTVEITSNRSPAIDLFNKYTGAPLGSSWCAGFVLYNYKEAADTFKVKQPLPVTGKVSYIYKAAKKNPYKYQVIKPSSVISKKEKLQPADVIIWSHGKAANNFEWAGHTGLVLSLSLIHI